MSPLEEFTLFSNLPAELRLKIWKLSIPHIRVVQLSAVTETVPHTTYIPHSHHLKAYCSDRSTPHILQINAESRAAGLEHYTLIGGTLLHGRPIYVNFSTDVFYISSIPDLFTFGLGHVFTGVQRIAINVGVQGLGLAFPSIARVLCPEVTHAHTVPTHWTPSTLLKLRERGGDQKSVLRSTIEQEDMVLVTSMINSFPT